MTRVFRHFSIRRKMQLLAVFSVCVAVALCTAGFVLYDVRALRTAKVRELQVQADMLGFNSSAVVTFRDAPAAERLLASLAGQPSVDCGGLYDADGQLLAAYRRAGTDQTPPATRGDVRPTGGIAVVRPLVDGGEEVGAVYLCANLNELRAQLWGYACVAATVVSAALAVGIFLSIGMQRSIADPIAELTATAKRVSLHHDYGVRLTRGSGDELGTLFAAFNHMLERIEASQQALHEAHDQLERRVAERTAELQAEVDERKRTQAALLRAKEAAEGANRAKSDFLANMSHEIRTPLNAVLGFTELLRRGADGGDERERQDFLSTIDSSGRHLLELINDILDLSKVEAGRMEVERTACSPQQIISEVMSVLRVRAQERSLSLESQWLGGVPEAIETDPARLRQLLMNLVGNAVKFTRQGGVRVLAAIRREGQRAKLVLDVIDTGVGIPADKLEAIFDPFVQADSSVTRQFGGTGLGLSICRRIVEALGGTLSVESEINRGSTFSATIDAGRSEDLRILDAPPADALRSGTRRCGAVVDIAGAEVLLVEDGDTNRKLIGLILRRAGAKVTMAENGLRGVERARARPFDLVLMDMQMPVMDGYTAATTLRNEGYDRPIIALTAHAMKGDQSKCLAAGCSGYLTKPVRADDLLRTVAEAIGPRPPEPAAVEPLVSTLPLDDAEFREIAEEFALRLADKRRTMAAALADGDFAALAREAHWLKGSGGTAGFAPFTQWAAALETAAQDRDARAAGAALDQIGRLAERIALPAATS